mgnify:CR=1 FL=1
MGDKSPKANQKHKQQQAKAKSATEETATASAAGGAEKVAMLPAATCSGQSRFSLLSGARATSQAATRSAGPAT